MSVKMVLQGALEDKYMQQIHDLGVETVVVVVVVVVVTTGLVYVTLPVEPLG